MAKVSAAMVATLTPTSSAPASLAEAARMARPGPGVVEQQVETAEDQHRDASGDEHYLRDVQRPQRNRGVGIGHPHRRGRVAPDEAHDPFQHQGDAEGGQHRHADVGSAHVPDHHDVDQPADGEHHRHDDGNRQERVKTQVLPQREGQKCRQHREGPVGEVDHPHDPEDQRQTRGHQRVERADEQAKDEGLDERGHEVQLLALRRSLRPQIGPPCQPRILSVVATSVGSTTCETPPCH